MTGSRLIEIVVALAIAVVLAGCAAPTMTESRSHDPGVLRDCGGSALVCSR